MGKLTCQDLMVGDLVYVHEPECKGHRIDYINEMDEEVGADGELYSINDIRPIHLTESIFVKNGFEYAYNEAADTYNIQLLVANIGSHYIEIRLDKRNVAIWYDYDEDGEGVYSDVLLDLPHHVHNFQHLLRLCGIEKEIKL